MIKTLSFIRQYLSFFLTLVCILGALGLAFFRGVDVTILLPTLLGLYLGARTIDKTNVAWAAVKDTDADAEAVMREHIDK